MKSTENLSGAGDIGNKGEPDVSAAQKRNIKLDKQAELVMLVPLPNPAINSDGTIPVKKHYASVAGDLPKEPQGEKLSITTISRLDRYLLVSGIVAIAIAILIYLFSRVAAEFVAIHSVYPGLGWCYLATIQIVIISIGLLGWRSWSRYRRLREVTQLRQTIERYQTPGMQLASDDRYLRSEFEAYLAELERDADQHIRESIGRVRNQLNLYSHSGGRDIEVITTHLMNSLDKQADEIIDKRAAQVAIASALASRTFDTLIVIWQSVKLIDQISQLYGGRPGVWGTVRLLRRAMANVVFAEMANLVTGAVAESVANKALAQVGGRVAEGMANGLLMLRVGEAVKRECRPVPIGHSGMNVFQRLGQALARQCVSKS